MKVASTYSISFYSDNLNKVKHGYLLDKAYAIRKFKNGLSEMICKMPSMIIGKTKNDFLKDYNTQVEGLVGREVQPALADVFTKYGNKIEQLNSKISFRVQSKIDITYYKKKTVKNEKGDLKDFSVRFKNTDLSRALSYYAKFYNPGLLDYMMKELDDLESRRTDGQLELYRLVFYYIDKFGDRFFALANARRTRVIKETFSKPIEFKKLTYGTINNLEQLIESKSEIIAESKNKESKITHYITLSGYKGITENGKLDIPVKYKSDYHGDISVFNKNQPFYLVQFVKDKVRFIFTKDGERTYKNDGNKILGADTNVKHNLFSTSDGQTIDFDRDLIKNYVKISLRADKMHDFLYKTEDKDLKPKELKKKNKMLWRLEKWDRKRTGHFIHKTHELIVLTQNSHSDILSMEDLCLANSSWYRSEEFFNLKYSRLVRILHLSSFKHIIENQCYNNNIQLTIVPSYYTSQRCHKCGFVHEDNRPNQEEFKCLHCGYEANADYNASQNIKQFMEIDVLKLQLLKQDPITGWWVSKINNKKEAKRILDDFFEKNNTRSYNAA